jgi:hypothetical protein
LHCDGDSIETVSGFPPVRRQVCCRNEGPLRSQLSLGQGVAQHLLDAGIVALAGRSYALDDIGGEAEPDMDLSASWRVVP